MLEKNEIIEQKSKFRTQEKYKRMSTEVKRKSGRVENKI